MDTFKTFATTQDARTHRQEHGTGGWIYADDVAPLVVLFPPHMTPSAIFQHPFTRGRSGSLIGNA